jgi:N-carbamoyl-D-amino-acid hydrolase
VLGRLGPGQLGESGGESVTVPDEVRVAAGQLGPADASRSATVKRIVALIKQAGAAGVGLLVLPELALSPYFAAEVHADIGRFVEPGFPSAETQPIVAAVRDAGVVTVLPHAELDHGAVYNSSVVLGADGTVIGRYRKSHIPGKTEPDQPGEFAILEKRYFAPGDLGFPLHDSPAGPFGIGICYDRRFPELYRCYALQGASAVACCFNTPVMTDRGETLESTQEAQELAVRGGAIANAVAVIAAGKAGVEGGTRFSAGSCVIDHRGRILAKAATEGDELVTAVLDLTAAAAARQRMDLEGNRRPELYGLLTAARALAQQAENV